MHAENKRASCCQPVCLGSRQLRRPFQRGYALTRSIGQAETGPTWFGGLYMLNGGFLAGRDRCRCFYRWPNARMNAMYAARRPLWKRLTYGNE